MNKGGPAFPFGTGYQGMTLRDYFAAKALEGMCAGQQSKMFSDQDHLAKGAYLLADAMLKARDQQT
jgi:hypothetical protein